MQTVSIITINYNNAAGLAATIRSVQEQDYAGIEYIIIDGGSDDGSADLVEGLPVQPHHFVSEPDNGIYHAMNKGIAKAGGTYLLFLNSGDRLVHASIITEIFAGSQQADIVFGDLQTEKGIMRYPAHPDFLFFFRNSIGHPASFIRKEMFDRYGLYNEQFKIVSDWEFFMKLVFRHKVSLQHIDKAISYYELDGMSYTAANMQLQLNERATVLKEYFMEYYPVLLQHLDTQQHELNRYRHSRAISLLQRFMKSGIYKAVTGKKT